MKKQKVLFIGWDAADWKIINPLMDNGLMPALNKLVDESVIGNISTLSPPLSPMLWTSIATGKTADKHGILGFVETDKENGTIGPIKNTSRKSRAIWNILNAQGYKCNVFSWWPSHPAEPINGLMVSNFFNSVSTNYNEEWPVSKGAVFPESYVKELKELRVHGEEITAQLIEPFIPKLLEMLDDLTDDDHKKISRIRKHLAECVSVQAQVTWAMENTEWDFTAVYFDTIDKLCHFFMQFAAPKMNKVSERDFEIYKYVINAIYVFHDMMLERLLALAGEDTTIVLVSDHGFQSGDLRPKSLPKIHASIALHHNPLGIFLMKGKGIKKDERIFGASLLDITPTLLAHLQLPVGRDMDGKVLAHCFEKSQEVKYIGSWESQKGDFGEHPKEYIPPAMNENEAIAQLAELGYIELEENKEEQFDKITKDNQYHLSVVYRTTGRELEALSILENLYELDKVDTRVNLDLIDTYIETDQTDKARSVFDFFKKLNTEKLVNFDRIEVNILLQEGKIKEAIQILEKLKKDGNSSIALLLQLANSYRIQKKYDEAKPIYETILASDSKDATALHGLGICLLKNEKFEEAADKCMEAIGIQFEMSACHFHLGEALIGLELYEDAANALELTLNLDPNTNRARKLLIDIYTKHLNNKVKASIHENYIKARKENEIIIVSGLPRSGTSMMMQLLDAGGIDVLTDEVRDKDANNPKGYYELEAVKTLKKNNGWLGNAVGKALKVVAPLLKELKLAFNYKIIFMERDLKEILISQEKMKLRNNPKLKNKGITYNLKLANAFENELKKVAIWEKQNKNIEILRVNYQTILEHPTKEIERINEFLNGTLNVKEMDGVIDRTLYREQLQKN